MMGLDTRFHGYDGTQMTCSLWRPSPYLYFLSRGEKSFAPTMNLRRTIVDSLCGLGESLGATLRRCKPKSAGFKPARQIRFLKSPSDRRSPSSRAEARDLRKFSPFGRNDIFIRPFFCALCGRSSLRLRLCRAAFLAAKSPAPHHPPLFQEVLLEIIDPAVAFVQLRIRREIKRAFELPTAWLEVNLLRRNFRMGRQVILRLNHFLSFFGQNEIEQEHRRVRMGRARYR